MTAVNNSLTLQKSYPQHQKALMEVLENKLPVVQLIFEYFTFGFFTPHRLNIDNATFYPLRSKDNTVFFHVTDSGDKKKLLIVELNLEVRYILLNVVIPKAFSDVPLPGEGNQLITRRGDEIYGVINTDADGMSLTALITWKMDPSRKTLSLQSSEVIRRAPQEDTPIHLDVDTFSNDTLVVGFQSGHITFIYPKVVFQFPKAEEGKKYNFLVPLSVIPMMLTTGARPKCGLAIVGKNLCLPHENGIRFVSLAQVVEGIPYEAHTDIDVEGTVHSVRALNSSYSATLAHNATESLIYIHSLNVFTSISTFTTPKEINTLFTAEGCFLLGTGSRQADFSNNLYVFSLSNFLKT